MLFLPFRKHCLGVVDRVSGRVLVQIVKDRESEYKEGKLGKGEEKERGKREGEWKEASLKIMSVSQDTIK